MQIGSQISCLQHVEIDGIGQSREGQWTQSGDTVASDQPRRKKPMNVVDESGSKQRGRERSAPFDQDGRQSLLGKTFHGCPEVDVSTGTGRKLENAVGVVSNLRNSPRSFATQDPGLGIALRLEESRGRRNAQSTIHEDPNRAANDAAPAASGELWVIGEHGVRAD